MQFRLSRTTDDVTLVDGGDHVFVKNVSMLTGVTSWMALPMTFAEFERAYDSWVDGVLMQNAFSTLSNDQREFLMTGITPTEWNDAFGDEDTVYP